jgi:hypothetical protein
MPFANAAVAAKANRLSLSRFFAREKFKWRNANISAIVRQSLPHY